MFYIYETTQPRICSPLLSTVVVTYVRNPLALSNSWLYGAAALLSLSLPLIFPLVVFSYPSYPLRLRFFLRRFSRTAPRYFAVCAFSRRSAVQPSYTLQCQSIPVDGVTKDVYVLSVSTIGRIISRYVHESCTTRNVGILINYILLSVTSFPSRVR